MYDKIFEEIGGAKFDARTLHRDLIFPSLEEALKHKDKFSALESIPSGKFADYVTIRLDDTHRIIIKGAEHADVRKTFMNDPTDYEVSVTFKLAEFHGYMHFKHLATGISKIIGASVDTPKALAGTWIIRNDAPYDEKYFRGVDTQISPKLDKASIGTEFLVTKDQCLHAISKIDEKHKSIPPDNQDFAFLGNNCHDFSHEVYTLLGLKGHEFDFIREERLDFRDRGAFYKCTMAHPPKQWLPMAFKMIYENPSVHVPTILNSAFTRKYLGEWIPKYALKAFNFCKDIYNKADWYLYYYLSSGTSEAANRQDVYGNNALHKAIIMEDFKAADEYLKMEVGSNVANAKGQTALHLAAGLSPSPLKLALLEKLIGLAHDINQPDLYADNIPLSFAVIANDPDAVRLLVKHGANPYFISDTKESLGIIAAETPSIEAAKALYELAPEIFYHDNMTRQFPGHHTILKEVLPITENAPPPKNYFEANNIVQDVLGHLHPLIEVLKPTITLELH